jgi:hypothetical protein
LKRRTAVEIDELLRAIDTVMHAQAGGGLPIETAGVA